MIRPEGPEYDAVYQSHTLLERLVAGGSYVFGKSVYGMCKEELRAGTPVPLSRKLQLWRRGFLSESAVLYDLSRHDPGEYLSEFVRRSRCRRINGFNDFFLHKLVLRSFLLAMRFPQAETVAIMINGRILVYPFTQHARHVPVDVLEELLIAGGDGYIVKPEDADEGEGIYLVESRDNGLVRRRGPHLAPWRAAEIGPRFTIIEQRLRQGAFWRDLHAESANTIRALTVWTPGEPAPFLARAVQRMGTTETIPTDNWTGGGLSASIDLASGRLGAALQRPSKSNYRRERFTRHPDSGAKIEGAVLPNWSRIRDTVLQAALRFPFNPYIGWDVLIDEAGDPIIIEANGNSGVNVIQAHGGLIADPRVRGFYEKTGVLRPADRVPGFQQPAGGPDRSEMASSANPLESVGSLEEERLPRRDDSPPRRTAESSRLLEAPSDPHSDSSPRQSLADRVLRSRSHKVARALYKMWKYERSIPTPVPFFRKLRLWRDGFLSESDVLYDFARNDSQDYLSDFVRRSRCRDLNPRNDFLNHKLVLRALLLAFGFPQAETLALVMGSRVLIDPFGAMARYGSGADLEALLLADGDQYLVKPEDGSGGESVYLLASVDGALVRRRGPAVAPWRPTDVGRRFTIIERRVRQGAFWEQLYRPSANTIRALTMWTPGEPAPFLARAVQRIGTADTEPTDNWTGGGISAPIDVTSGKLGTAIALRRSSKTDYRRERLRCHPNSGVPIEGAVLPDWGLIRDSVLSAALRFPFNPYIGWDVLVDESSAPIIIEANGNSGLDVIQAHGGLLTDPAVRGFYEKSDVI